MSPPVSKEPAGGDGTQVAAQALLGPLYFARHVDQFLLEAPDLGDAADRVFDGDKIAPGERGGFFGQGLERLHDLAHAEPQSEQGQEQ